MTAAFIADGPDRATLGNPTSHPASVVGDAGVMRAAPAGARSAPGAWFARVRRAFVRARMREAERHVETYVNSCGGRLTDRIERDILDEITGIGRRGFGA